MKLQLHLVLATLFASATTAFAAGMFVGDENQWLPRQPDESQERWRVFPRHGPRFATLELVQLKVRVQVRDQIATTTIDQEFHNPGRSRVEGTFMFPVPKDSHLDKFEMVIDGKSVAAELLPAEQARSVYEGIVRRAQDPGLLEYAGSRMYKVRIFPVEAGQTRKVQLRYTQLLEMDSGLVTYELPLSAGKYSAKPPKEMSINLDVRTSRPLKTIYSPTHQVEVTREGSTRAKASYKATEEMNLHEPFRVLISQEREGVALNWLTWKPPGEDGYFLLLASPGVDTSENDLVPKDVVLVLDNSGSMAGKKLDQAKKALAFCIANLDERDRFEVVRFSDDVEPLFCVLRTASATNKDEAERFVRGLAPTGGTAIAHALATSLKTMTRQEERLPVIIFLTDGQPTVGEKDPGKILSALRSNNQCRARVFCFGIGGDVNTHLLDGISRETGGATAYVLPEEDLEIKVSRFFEKIKNPVIANPKLTFNGDVRVSRMYPETLPDLFMGEQVVMVGRFKGVGEGSAVLEGTLRGGKRQFTYELHAANPRMSTDFLPRMWAQRRVAALLDEIRLHGDNDELREEIISLARKYSIVTPYTAYLIVEDEAQRRIPAEFRSLQSFDRDNAAREQASAAWREYKTQTSGTAAVADAGQGTALASAPSSGIDMEARMRFMRRYGMSPAKGTPPASAAGRTAAETASRVNQYSQQSRYVAGKTFFENGGVWVDADLQRAPGMKIQRVHFGSPEYFRLLNEHPHASQWLALGTHIKVVIAGKAYEITLAETAGAAR